MGTHTYKYMDNNEEPLYLKKKTDLGTTDYYYPKESLAIWRKAGLRQGLSICSREMAAHLEFYTEPNP